MFNVHAPASLVSALVVGWDTYFSFGFVRNPWDYWVSLYYHVLTIGPSHPEWQVVSRFDGFRSYMLNYVEPLSRDTYILNQIDYLADHSGLPCVSEVGRFESLHADFDRFCSQIGINNVSLPRLNASSRVSDYHDCYDLRTRDIVTQINQRDLEVFGYRF
ncbi:hypothetical protein MPLA_320043 [Mesorhizobium sp. ORS 3359]|nr:hypothetical protein MPLA_320043 [Mesorhizobium sp. ORS 3359]